MDWIGLYHFLFETYAGMGIMIGAGLVISLIACIIMERRTRKTFVDRPKGKDDWSFFDDDDEEGLGITTRRPLTPAAEPAPQRQYAGRFLFARTQKSPASTTLGGLFVSRFEATARSRWHPARTSAP